MQHIGVDYDDDAVNLEQKDILTSKAEESSTVPVHKDSEDINSALSDSLSPELEEVWQYGCPQSPMWDSVCDCSENFHDNTFEEGSVTSSIHILRIAQSTMSTTYGIPCWHLCAILKLALCWRHSSTK